jgi:hypothetical protein
MWILGDITLNSALARHQFEWVAGKTVLNRTPRAKTRDRETRRWGERGRQGEGDTETEREGEPKMCIRLDYGIR